MLTEKSSKNRASQFRHQVVKGLMGLVKKIHLLVHRPEPFPYTHAWLRLLPKHTLGYQTAHFLDERKFRLMKFYESHDFKHVLFSYEMDAEGELRLQFFLYGNGSRSIATLGCMLLGYLLMPEYKTLFRQDVAWGRMFHDLRHASWPMLMEKDLDQVRRELLRPERMYALEND